MESPVITYEMLCEISGYETPAEVAVWLVENNIPYMIGKFRRPTTTINAINEALGVGIFKDTKTRKVVA